MIVDLIKGNIFDDSPSNIVFAINIEGHNDAGFAGVVSGKFWPKLANTGPVEIGQTFHYDDPDSHIHFHAIVCHSLKDGWTDAPIHIEEGLNRVHTIKVAESPTRPASVVMMGAGMIGQMQGADVWRNLGAIARSKLACWVYTL
jgi:hypothetical protein